MARKPEERADTKARVFDKADLITRSRQLFGQSPDVVAGALWDIKECITVDKAVDRVNRFLSTPVNAERS